MRGGSPLPGGEGKGEAGDGNPQGWDPCSGAGKIFFHDLDVAWKSEPREEERQATERPEQGGGWKFRKKGK